MSTEVQCTGCHDFILEEEAEEVFGEVYCEGCRVQCEDCFEYICHGDEIYSSDGGAYCDRCFGNADECFICGDWWKSNEQIKYYNRWGQECEGWVCPSCRNGVVRPCNVCGEGYIEITTHGVCPPCRADQVHIHEGENPGRIISLSRPAGVEIELEQKTDWRPNLSEELPAGVQQTADSSIDFGHEFITPPATLDKLERIIEETCRVVSVHDYYPGESCGLHIHLDARDIRASQTDLDRLALIYLMFEPILNAIIPEYRRDCNWARLLSECHNMSHEDLVDIKKRQQLKAEKALTTKYVAVNLGAIVKGTVEIRSHSPTMNPVKILRWIDIHQHIMDYSKEYTTDEVEAYLRLRDLYDKADLMATLIGLSVKTGEYIKYRIEKFEDPSDRDYDDDEAGVPIYQ